MFRYSLGSHSIVRGYARRPDPGTRRAAGKKTPRKLFTSGRLAPQVIHLGTCTNTTREYKKSTSSTSGTGLRPRKLQMILHIRLRPNVKNCKDVRSAVTCLPDWRRRPRATSRWPAAPARSAKRSRSARACASSPPGIRRARSKSPRSRWPRAWTARRSAARRGTAAITRRRRDPRTVPRMPCPHPARDAAVTAEHAGSPACAVVAAMKPTQENTAATAKNDRDRRNFPDFIGVPSPVFFVLH